MTFSIILIGALIILSIFDVGEGIWQKVQLNKRWFIILLLVNLILYFVPNITINGIVFTWVGFVLPTLFSVVIFLGVRKKVDFVKIFINTLLSFSICIAYNLVTFDVYEQNIFQPYIILGIILGIMPIIIQKNPKCVYVSNTIGIILSELFFYFSRYSIYGEYYLTLGSEKVFCCLIVSFIVSSMLYFVLRKYKAFKLKRSLLKRERENSVNF